MRKLSIILTLVSTMSVSAQSDSIRVYVTNALNVMKEKSVNKKKVNWKEVYDKTLQESLKAKTIAETYPIIKNSLAYLEDSHSNFYPKDVVKEYTLGYKATGQEFPVIKSELLKDNYAYISLPDIGSFNNDDWNTYINNFYSKVNDLRKHNPKGWIIDLRGNFGGMLYPMYAAIAPFLDKKNVVGTKDSEGNITYFNYKNGKFYEGSKATQQFQLTEKEPKQIDESVAILIDKVTGSSAEFIAAAFVGQKNVKLVGVNSQGLTSGNQEYKLSDGSFLVLTIGNIVDRTGKEYTKIGEGITPNIKIEKSNDKEKTNEQYLNKAFEYIDGK